MSAPKKSVQEREMQKRLAFEYAKKYCSEHNLSTDKLMKQQFEIIYGSAIFAQPSDVEPKGLTNDAETMPRPTLIIKIDNDQLKIEQTEYTKQFLSV